MKSKNMIIIFLLIIIVLMAVGYAAFAQILTINGTANISANWDVKITDISEGTLIGAVSKTAAVVGNDGLSATFDVDLKYPGASATYIVTVQNSGTIDAILNDINGVEQANSIEPKDIVYSIDANTNDLLNSGTTKVYTVTVTWNDTNKMPTILSKTATITLNFVQNT